MEKIAETFVPELEDAIAEGHYAKKQLGCKDRLISWSHRSRFEMGLRLARKYARGRVLDYGCGDGTFVAMLSSSEQKELREIVGAEVDQSLVTDCRTRLGKLPRLVFNRIDELDRKSQAETFETIFCMEVLEHVVPLNEVLDRLERLLSVEGHLIISVPVETGLPLLVKQAVRRVAGWRGMGDYKYTSAYTLKEYGASLLPGARQHIRRVAYGAETGSPFYDHKGFNWMLLRKSLEERFTIHETIGSPLRWLPPHLASQVWFVAGKKRVGEL